MPAPQQQELAEAVSTLTPADLKYLQEHGMIDVPELPSNRPTQVTVTQEEPDTQPHTPAPKPKRKRRALKHEWPDVDTILQADYAGEHYEAQVVPAAKYKSRKALKLLNGSAAGKTSSSFTGAMMIATEDQRKREDLGRKGIANGWTFWRVKKGGGP